MSARFVTDITPPHPTVSAPVRFEGPVVVRFDEPVRGVTAHSVVLAAAGGGAAPTTQVCRSLTAPVACASGAVRSVALTPRFRWTPGRDYEVLVDPAGVTPRVRDRIGNAVPATALPFEGPKGFEGDAAPVTAAWGTVDSPVAFGGSFAVSRQRGASFAFAFRGPSVTWYTVKGPAFGEAAVTIDGRARGRIDLWAARRATHVAETYSGLGAGAHTIVVHATGRTRSAASDRLVAIDAFRGGGTIVADPRGTQSLRRVNAAGASGGSYSVDDVAGAGVTVRFDGTGIDWTSVTAPDRGRARVYVDGVLVDTVDLYAPIRTFGVVESVSGLAGGSHRLTISATGTARASSAGTLVAIDRFDVT